MECFDVRNQLRAKEYFGFDWQFALTDRQDRPGPQTLWRPVQLPHDWSVDYPVEQQNPSCGSGGYARTGIGWYRRSFQVASLAGQQLSLLFDGIYMNCSVWINDRYVGGHVYGYTSFEMDISPFIHNGENDILIRVDNSHQPGSRWYSGSGITRDVWLVATGSVHIATWGLFASTRSVTDQCAIVDLEVKTVCASEPVSVCAVAQVSQNGTVCAQSMAAVIQGGQTTHLSISIPDPKRWDLDSPVLYSADVTLTRDNDPVDRMNVVFGIREIAYNAYRGFLLNGRKVILQGVCLHHDGGCVGAAVPREVWFRRLQKIKAMGCNALRCSHNPPDPALLELADELGFVVMDEAFDEWQRMKGKEFGSNTHESRGYSEWFDACWEADVTSMLLRDRNHPSIIMWSIGNEIHEQVTPDGWTVARKLAGLCHALDHTRPVTAACDQVKGEPIPAYTAFLDTLDLVGVNYTDRWRGRTETFFDEEKSEHPDWLLMGTEDVSVGGPRGDYSLVNEGGVWGRNSYYSRMLKAEKLWKYVSTRPFVIGDFMWTGIDYLGECFWPGKGSCSGVMDTCGYEKDGYFFYQSQWVKDRPVLHVFPHLNLNIEPGTVIPVVVYTNCFSVELFVNGRSWGMKAYEFPAQGMTKEWAHFDRPFAPVTTNDLHLTWDVPYQPDDEWVVIGCDAEGKEIARRTICRTGKASSFDVDYDCGSVAADGRSTVQLDITLRDAAGNCVTDDDRQVSVTVENGELLGMDNGDQTDLTPYRAGTRSTCHGLAYGIVRKNLGEAPLTVTVAVDGIGEKRIRIPCKTA